MTIGVGLVGTATGTLEDGLKGGGGGGGSGDRVGGGFASGGGLI